MAADPWSRQCPCSFVMCSWARRKTAEQSSCKHFKKIPFPPTLPLGSTGAPVGWHDTGVPADVKPVFLPVWPRTFVKGTAGGALCLPCHMYGYLFFTVMFKRMYEQFTFSLEIHWWDHSWVKKKTHQPPVNLPLAYVDLEVNLYGVKVQMLFKLQQGLSSWGWRGPQESLHLRFQGFWGLDVEVAQTPITWLLTLHLRFLCNFSLKKKSKTSF